MKDAGDVADVERPNVAADHVVPRWATTLAFVAAAPLAGWALTATATTQIAPANPDEPRPATSPRCEGIEPARFKIAPGATQRLRVHFSDDPGVTDFIWSAAAGRLEPVTGQSIRGRVLVERFEGPTADPRIWQAIQDDAGAMHMLRGAFAVTVPAGAPADSFYRLTSLPTFPGDVEARVRVASLTADGSLGTAALVISTPDGASAHVMRIAVHDHQMLESNARRPGRPWPASRPVDAESAEYELFLRREGTELTSEATVDGRVVRFDKQAAPAGDAWVLLEAGSQVDSPAVNALYEDVRMIDGSAITWRAPDDAAPGTEIRVGVGGTCFATAVVGAGR